MNNHNSTIKDNINIDYGLTGLANLNTFILILACKYYHIANCLYLLNSLNINKLNNIDDSILLVEWKQLKDNGKIVVQLHKIDFKNYTSCIKAKI